MLDELFFQHFDPWFAAPFGIAFAVYWVAEKLGSKKSSDYAFYALLIALSLLLGVWFFLPAREP